MMQTHKIEAELGKPVRLSFDVVLRGSEERIGRQIRSPEPSRRIILEYEPTRARFQETALPGRPFERIQKRQIYGR